MNYDLKLLLFMLTIALSCPSAQPASRDLDLQAGLTKPFTVKASPVGRLHTWRSDSSISMQCDALKKALDFV